MLFRSRRSEAISLLEEEELGSRWFFSSSVEIRTSHSSRECHSSSRGWRAREGLGGGGRLYLVWCESYGK